MGHFVYSPRVDTHPTRPRGIEERPWTLRKWTGLSPYRRSAVTGPWMTHGASSRPPPPSPQGVPSPRLDKERISESARIRRDPRDVPELITKPTLHGRQDSLRLSLGPSKMLYLTPLFREPCPFNYPVRHRPLSTLS